MGVLVRLRTRAAPRAVQILTVIREFFLKIDHNARFLDKAAPVALRCHCGCDRRAPRSTLYWFLQVPGICSFNLTIEVQQNQPGRVSVMLLPIIFSVALWLRKVKMQQFRCKPEPRYKLRNVKKSMKCHTNHNFGGLVLGPMATDSFGSCCI